MLLKKNHQLKPYQNPEIIELGIDEAGRGCLFGSLFIASVILPNHFLELIENNKITIKDSKKMSKKKRLESEKFIKENALAYSIHEVSSSLIDEKNILKCTLEGMHEVVRKSSVKPDKILVDGNKFYPYYDEEDNIILHECIIGGDNTYLSIACASILAKTAKDNYIKDMVEKYNYLEKYDLLNNSGYGTKKHIKAIQEFGISEFHRKTFGICNGIMKKDKIKKKKDDYQLKKQELNKIIQNCSLFKS